MKLQVSNFTEVALPRDESVLDNGIQLTRDYSNSKQHRFRVRVYYDITRICSSLCDVFVCTSLPMRTCSSVWKLVSEPKLHVSIARFLHNC